MRTHGVEGFNQAATTNNIGRYEITGCPVNARPVISVNKADYLEYRADRFVSPILGDMPHNGTSDLLEAL